MYVTNTNLESWKEYMKNTWRKPNTKLNFACTICHLIMFSWEGFSISYGYRMAISLAANPIVFQCFRMRSRVAYGVFWDVRLEGFWLRSGSGSVQERELNEPVNRTKDTNTDIGTERLWHFHLVYNGWLWSLWTLRKYTKNTHFHRISHYMYVMEMLLKCCPNSWLLCLA